VQRKRQEAVQKLALGGRMYKRKSNQVSIFDDPAMFGGIPLNPENERVKLSKLIP